MTANDQNSPKDDQLNAEIEAALTSSLPEPTETGIEELSTEQIDRILARSHAPTVVPFPGRSPASPPRRPWHTTLAYTAAATIAVAAALAVTLFVLNRPDSSDPATPEIAITPPPPPAPSVPPSTNPPQPPPFDPVTITTGATEKRRLELPDGSVLFVRENSSAILTKPRHIELTKGEVYLQVAKDPDGKTFAVVTPDRRVTALGTRFSVAVEPAGTSVLVTQGKVEATGAPALLVAGQKLSAADATIVPAPRYDHGLAWTRDLVIAAGPAIIPSSDYAGGALVSTNPDGPDHRFALRKLHVDVHIQDGFARTTIDQTYFNHLNRRLEGTFYFPLPADASISRLAMYVGENLMEGGMAERNHARQTFESIKHKMKDPALLEWMDGSTFRMRVFPLEGRQEKRIVISYTQQLESLANTTTYRFPVGHSQEKIGDWSVNVRAQNAPAQKWHSPSHDLTATTEASDLILTTSEANHLPGNDLVLHLQSAQVQPSVRTATLDNWTYLMLDHVPELPAAPQQTPKRDWIVIMETSGDRTPVLARTAIEVLRTIANNVDHTDTITLITADTLPSSSEPQPAPANDLFTIAENAQLLGALDLETAFSKSRELSAGLDNPIILHLGSGTPVLGERDHAALVRTLPETVPYIGVGIGKSWNRNLMRTAAARSSGLTVNINPDQPVNWAAFQLLSRLNAPRISEIKFTDDRHNTYLNLTASLSQGQHATAITRFPSDATLPTSITFNGHPIPVGKPTAGAGYLPRTWAKLEIDRLVAAGSEENRERIITLSKASYVVSPFTSLLVLENDEMYAQYNIDRGRKDHWALYPCPGKIEVVHEPLQNNKPSKPDDTPLAAIASWCPAAPSSFATPLSTVFDELAIEYPRRSIIWAGQARFGDRIPFLSDIPRLGRLFRSPAKVLWNIPTNSESDFTTADFDSIRYDYGFGAPTVTTAPVGYQTGGFLFDNRRNFSLDRYYIDLNLQPQVVEFEGFINYKPLSYFRAPVRGNSANRGGTAGSGFITAGKLRGATVQPNPIRHPRPWHNLISHAPSFVPTPADALTVAAEMAKLPASIKTGHVDPAARSLIENARASLPAAAELTTDSGQLVATFHSITADTITYSHTTPTGLTEIATMSPTTFTHAYPALSLATERTSSPFHRLELFSRLPFILPSANDLALNASVHAVDDKTVTVTCGEKIALTLTFSDDSKLESLTRHSPSESTITFSPDGTIKVADRITLKLTPVEPTASPAAPDLFTLPAPALSSSEDPRHHLAGHVFNQPSTIQGHIAQDHFKKNQRLLGLYTLLFNGNPNFDSTHDASGTKITFDPLLDHPNSPLAHYIASGHRLAAGDSLLPPDPNAPASFISRLAHTRYIDWALADETRHSDLDALFINTLDAIDAHVAPALSRTVLTYAYPLLDKLKPGTLKTLADAAADLFADNPSDLQIARLQIKFLTRTADPDLVQQAISSITETIQDKATSSLLAIQLHEIAESRADLSDAFAALAATEPTDRPPFFWQLAAALAENHSRTLDAITFHQRAADIYYDARSSSSNTSHPAAIFAPLLKAQARAAGAMVQLQQKPDQSFIDSVIQNADRWRSLERQNPTVPCNEAAACLEALGLIDLAWRYRTDDLAHHPREKSSWLAIAQLAASLNRPTFADQAFGTAFSLEETNATILLQHARFLIAQQRTAEARTLLEKITSSTWGPDFRNTQNQASNLLSRSPFR